MDVLCPGQFSQCLLDAHSEPGARSQVWAEVLGHKDGQDIVPVLEDLTVYRESVGVGERH